MSSNIIQVFLQKWMKPLVIAVVMAIIVKVLFFQTYKVNSQNMEKTIVKGDFVVVNKSVFGARLPVTLLSLPFFQEIYSSLIELPYMRLPGIGNLKTGDIIVFNSPVLNDIPIDKKRIMISRCVGLPGDTVFIDNKKVYINGNLIPDEQGVQYCYRLVVNGDKLSEAFTNDYDISQGGMVSLIGIYDFPLTKEKLKKVESDKRIRYVRELKDFKGEHVSDIFPQSRVFTFNKDYFGRVVIPEKGQTIHITPVNIELYKDIIVRYEGNNLVVDGNDIIINGDYTEEYTFNGNYYFVLDDNRDFAYDSRYWGFLPESHIIGKVF